MWTFIAATYPCLSFCIVNAGIAAAAPGPFALIAGVIAMLAALDVRARWRDYRRVCSLLAHPRINLEVLLRRYRHSWCQRTAATAAWRTVRGTNTARGFYRSLGYRWWHVLPDGTFSRRSPYLNPAFYRALITARS